MREARGIGMASLAAMALFGGGMSRKDVRDMEARRARAADFKRYLLTNQKRTPKPEKMFEHLIRSGRAKIVRRRFKQPLLVFTKEYAR